jgi:hypothetical protein
LLHSKGLERRQGHRVLAVFGAFRLLLGGSTHVQLPLAKYEIYLTFSKSTYIYIFIYTYSIFSLGLNIIIKGITSSTLAIKILFISKNLVAIAPAIAPNAKNKLIP